MKNYSFLNNTSSIKISLASPKQLLINSKGEVRNSETLNYRSFYPEKGGLFCIKIFGPIKNFECLCGFFSGKKKINLICPFCHGEVISSKSRRSRLGHIRLKSGCLNTVFYRSTPSYLSLILNLSVFTIDNILYGNYYIVLYSGNTLLKLNQILSFSEYLYYIKKYNGLFYADTGFNAIYKVLDSIDLLLEIKLLKKFFINNKNYCSSIYKKKLNRYKILKSLYVSNINLSTLIIKVLPVLPADLRPIIKLSDGSLVSSDLNELYKRVIDRNNRLNKLYSIDAPEIIISNERKLLQESIDNLFDNSSSSNVIAYNASTKQPLKSISDVIKGKFGIFRQNLLGKRVDYSARTVIVSGPNLKLNECVLPKLIALELFRPFIYNRLLFLKNFNIKLARIEVDKGSILAIEILKRILKDNLVLLNRAPTLHKLGIQAFKVILGDEKVVKLHPLVCSSFNADFDGDQMAIHLPISIRSRVEFKSLLMSSNNIFLPSNGSCSIAPTQDIILGIYYSTKFDGNFFYNKYMIFDNLSHILNAYLFRLIRVNTKILYRLREYNSNNYNIYETTMGRIMIYNLLPKGFLFNSINKVLKKNDINKLLDDIYEKFGSNYLLEFCDSLMKLGFNFATQSGISISINDIITHEKKDIIINDAKKISMLYDIDYLNGLLSKLNRKRKILDVWGLAIDIITNITTQIFFNNSCYFNNLEVKSINSLQCMIDSGARGSESQIKQISCLRGFMFYKDKGLLEIPVISNLKEGLNALEYFYFSHGSRKTLADTALKTSNAGYLTRRLVEAAGNIVISEIDCGTTNGINFKSLINKNGNVVEKFSVRILGRVICDDLFDSDNINLLLYPRNTVISKYNLECILKLNLNILKIRSPLTCESKNGLCVLCYGYDLSKKKLVNIGEAVGVIAAQSIGEPGTQLTMRTFHTAGSFSKDIIRSSLYSNNTGILEYSSSLNYIYDKNNLKIVISKTGTVKIKNLKGEELQVLRIPYSSLLLINNNSFIKEGDLVCKWNPYYRSIISNCSGFISFKNFLENINYIKRLDLKTGISNLEILPYGSTSYIPYIELLCNNDNFCGKNKFYNYNLDSGDFVVVNNNTYITAGELLVKSFIDLSDNIDITGGLPKIIELFEAIVPKNPALMSHIDGKIYIKKNNKNKKKYIIVKNSNKTISYKKINFNKNQLLVQEGCFVNKGDILIPGNINPHDILSIYNINGFVDFLLTEIKDIYLSQGVVINDKHIEIIIKKMLSNVIVIDKGDSSYILGEIIEKIEVDTINREISLKYGKLIKYDYILSGITKSSLNSKSFLNSASFQQTLSVLAKAAIFDRENKFSSIKESLMSGNPIPAGTGFYLNVFKKEINNF